MKLRRLRCKYCGHLVVPTTPEDRKNYVKDFRWRHSKVRLISEIACRWGGIATPEWYEEDKENKFADGFQKEASNS